MKIVVDAGQKGGVGKTTTSVNLAAVLSESLRVLLTDVDSQRSAAWWADQAGEDLPFDVADDVDPKNLAQLRRLDYDVVIVDTPGNLDASEVLRTVVAQADFVILPTESGAPLALPPLIKTIKTLIKPVGVDYRVLVNKVDPRPSVGEPDVRDIRNLLDAAGIACFRSVVKNYKVHATAPAHGKVVTQYAGDARSLRAATDFRKVAAELQGIWNGAVPNASTIPEPRPDTTEPAAEPALKAVN